MPVLRVGYRGPLAALLLSLFASVPALHGQRFSFQTYSRTDGLQNLSIRCMVQDRTGFLWFGTANGLFRYDGSRFKAFRQADGLPSSQIRILHVSGDGTLLVGTSDGVARLDGDRFVQLKVAPPPLVRGQYSIDTDSRGRVLVAGGDALWIADNPRGQFRKISPPERYQWVHSVHVAGGTVWAACGTSLCILRDDSRLEETGTSLGLPSDSWRAILADRVGNLWMRSQDQVYVLASGASGFQSAGHNLPDSNSSVGLFLDPDGHVWAPTRFGLFYRESGNWKRIGEPQGLPADPACCVMWDHEGNPWVGLESHGVARWLGFREWETWTRSQGLSSNSIHTIRRQSGGPLWVGTDNGLSVMKGDTWKVFTRKDGLADDRVHALAFDPKGALWAGSIEGGLARLDPDSGRFRRFDRDSGLGNNRVVSIVTGAANSLWVATQAGLFRASLDRDVPRFEQVPLPLDNQSVPCGRLLHDTQGRLWVPTYDGLLRLENGKWQIFTHKNGLLDDNVSMVAEGPGNSIWIAYARPLGVTRVSPSVQHFSEKDGLRSAEVRFLEGSQGRLWAGTDEGIDVYERDSWHRGPDDGLIWQNTTPSAFSADADGRIWVGTTTGLFGYKQRPGVPKRPPVVVVSSLNVNENRVTLDYAGLTFASERDVRFRYRLQGLNSDWIETSQRQIAFPALSPGDYTFEVLARSSQGVWSTQPARATFRIPPPWWGTWWFRLLLFVTMMAALREVWRLRNRRLLQKQSQLERAVRERTSEIQLEKAIVEQQKWGIEHLLDEARESGRLKGEFLANMSHEIRTPLHGILGMTALSLETKLTPDQRDYILTAYSSAQSLLNLLNDILDFSKIDAGQVEIQRQRLSVRELVADCVKTSSPAALAKSLTLTYEVDPRIPELVSGDPDRLRQILTNLISNAVKFTETGSVEVRAFLDLQTESEALIKFSVKDTGIGIPREQHQVIFDLFRQADGSLTRKYGGTGLGLTICARLVDLMGGGIWVESDVGKGATFHCTLRLGLHQSAPMYSASDLQRLDEHTKSADDPNGSEPILVVEDSRVNQTVASRLLEKRGYRVVVAENGHQAVVLHSLQKFSLILMDLMMPVMDGLTALQQIRIKERATGEHVPVLILSAKAAVEDRERGIEAGADGYLTKPLEPAELYQTLEKFLTSGKSPSPPPQSEELRSA